VFVFVLFIPLIGVCVSDRAGRLDAMNGQCSSTDQAKSPQLYPESRVGFTASTADQLAKLADLRDGSYLPEDSIARRRKVLA